MCHLEQKVRTQSACHQSLESYLWEFHLDTISLLEGKPVWSYRWRIQISLWKQMWGALIASWSTVEILACRMSEFFMLSSDLQQQTSFFLLWIWHLADCVDVGSDVVTCSDLVFKLGTEVREKGSGRSNRSKSEPPMTSPWQTLWIIFHCMYSFWNSFVPTLQLKVRAVFWVCILLTAQLLTWRCQDLVDYSDLNEMHGVKRRQSEGDVML